MLALLVALSVAVAPAARGIDCPTVAAAGAPIAITSETEARDTLVTVRICLVAPRGGRVGSYHGELTFAPAEARVLRVQRPNEGMRVENANAPGTVSFAGAIPNGLASGELLTVLLRVMEPRRTLITHLRVVELNDVRGSSLLAEARVGEILR